MSSIEPPDSHHVSAATGWLELGNAVEARIELDKVASGLRDHPDVLEVEFGIAARAGAWPDAARIAERLVEKAPNRPSGWIDRSNALHFMGHYGEAYELLQPALAHFPSLWTLPYNMACFCCRMGKLDEAKTWLGKAIELGQQINVVRGALNDPDLEPLRDHIEGLAGGGVI
jgi:tetratricopeptide (TPR) repeat protein